MKKRTEKKERRPPSSYDTMPHYYPTEQVDIVDEMKKKKRIRKLRKARKRR